MRTHHSLALSASLAALALSACTPETPSDPDQTVTDDIVEATDRDVDPQQPIARETPLPPETDAANSADTDQPTLGVDQVDTDALGSGAEPARPIGD
ncbi:hypothetical protein [Erythrobacter sp. JK5]|uniref:hypothetical protein n=1 Tax=Erythrobacter sp. JK5 TaxID=2829500 RepID=UPI001BA7FF5D|nr:hypothetical protein [Erythrobacter sp. JK5]QUL37017.1 hypothetical protein KDC96_11510 [Erythrobacter sp. JK5]